MHIGRTRGGAEITPCIASQKIFHWGMQIFVIWFAILTLGGICALRKIIRRPRALLDLLPQTPAQVSSLQFYIDWCCEFIRVGS